MHTLDSLRGAFLLLAIVPLMEACSQQADPQAAIRRAEAVQRAIAALPPTCTLGVPRASGTWLNTTKAVPASVPGDGTANVFSFDKAVPTRALRVALDLQALSNIERVETRDAEGKWRDAGPIGHREAPIACEYVWLELALPETRRVDALRFTFRQAPGTITTANPGVLQESVAQ